MINKLPLYFSQSQQKNIVVGTGNDLFTRDMRLNDTVIKRCDYSSDASFAFDVDALQFTKSAMLDNHDFTRYVDTGLPISDADIDLIDDLTPFREE